jgi:hypothetical protein
MQTTFFDVQQQMNRNTSLLFCQWPLLVENIHSHVSGKQKLNNRSFSLKGLYASRVASMPV